MPTLDGGATPHGDQDTHVRDRADTFRATLGARQEADALLAEATEVRRQAGVQAEGLVAEAEQIGRDLSAQARSEAERTAAEARERADGILAQARESAEAIRARAEADAEAAQGRLAARLEAENEERLHGVRHRAEELVAGLETVLRGLGSTLQQAQGAVEEIERTLHRVRTDALEQLPETPAGPAPRVVVEGVASAAPHPATDPGPHPGASPAEVEPARLEVVETAGDVTEETAEDATAITQVELDPASIVRATADRHPVDHDQRPLGWLFRSTKP